MSFEPHKKTNPSKYVKIKIFTIQIAPANLAQELETKLNDEVNFWIDSYQITKDRFVSVETELVWVQKIVGWLKLVTIAYV